jgi:hypothetical protein
MKYQFRFPILAKHNKKSICFYRFDYDTKNLEKIIHLILDADVGKRDHQDQILIDKYEKNLSTLSS